jgi:hypothetical protein
LQNIATAKAAKNSAVNFDMKKKGRERMKKMKKMPCFEKGKYSVYLDCNLKR